MKNAVRKSKKNSFKIFLQKIFFFLILVCKPREFCEEILLTEEVLESGMHKFINESGCCPHIEILCRPETCPEPKSCRKYYLRKLINTTDCCPHYICGKY